MIISIDPGHRTGICVLYTYDNEKHIDLFTVNGADIKVLRYCTNLNRITIIVERMPKVMSMKMSTIMQDLDTQLREMFKQSLDTVERIAPSEWKPMCRARKWKCEAKIHERDAYNMVRYYMFTSSLNIDLGDYVG